MCEEDRARHRGRIMMQAAKKTRRLGSARPDEAEVDIDDAGERSKEKRPSRQLRDRELMLAQEKTGFLPGATLETLVPTIMRVREAMDSDIVEELRPREEVMIEALGEGTRLQVRSITSGLLGWVSTRTIGDAMDLVRLKYEAPGEAYGPGAIATVASESAIMRETEAMDSPKVMDCPSGERLRVLGYPIGRRVKVERLKTGDVGWVSATAQEGVRLLKLSEEQPWRAEAFAVGAIIVSFRTVILRSDESTKSAILLECQAGEECIIAQRGEGFRLKVRHLSTATVGWVSSASSQGAFLFGLKSEGLRVGQGVETAAQVTVREDEDLTSRVVEEVAVGERCTVIAPPVGRRVKVQVARTGATGYVSSVTKDGHLLLLPDEADGDSREASAHEAEAASARCSKDVEVVVETLGVAASRPSGRSGSSKGATEVGAADGRAAAAATKPNEASGSILSQIADAIGPTCSAGCAALRGDTCASFVKTAADAAKAAGRALTGKAAAEDVDDPAPRRVRAVASVGYTSRQANTTFDKWEGFREEPKLPLGAQEMPGGCLFCMFAKIKLSRH